MTRPDESDRVRAESLGRLVDTLLEGKPAPPALAAEDRALLETAALVRSAFSVSAPAPEAQAPRARRRPLLPWTLTGVAALAAIVFAALAARPSAARLSPEQPSRAVDALVGPIEPGSDATRRADLVYADRLARYRQIGHTTKVRPP